MDRAPPTPPARPGSRCRSARSEEARRWVASPGGSKFPTVPELRWYASASTGMAQGRCSRRGAPQPEPILAESGIEKRRQYVDEDVHDQDHQRDDPDERFDQRDITRCHGIQRQSTDSGIRENALDDHGAPE